ncbi:MAG: hypothetical protein EZS28_035812, partial [Streblomastix strix]
MTALITTTAPTQDKDYFSCNTMIVSGQFVPVTTDTTLKRVIESQTDQDGTYIDWPLPVVKVVSFGGHTLVLSGTGEVGYFKTSEAFVFDPNQEPSSKVIEMEQI